MPKTVAPAVWTLAVAAIIAGCYFFRDTLTQFALAMLLYLVIDGFATWLDHRIPGMPRALALPIAILIVLSVVTVVIWVIAQNIGSFAAGAPLYEARLNAIAAQLYVAAGMSGPPPTIDQAISDAGPQSIFTAIASGLQGVVSDVILILIFLGFLFPAAAVMPRKLLAVFKDPADSLHASEVLHSIRNSIDKYLYVQTVMSILISALTYATLTIIGLPNALFWAFLIFFLNYIPTIGSIVAVVLPTAFALVHFPDLAHVAAVALGVGAWQFLIGNFIQPRMTGESLNLDPIVVLLALALFGTLFGIAGAFLSAPICVAIMVICAQFTPTRWIAILLSADARPTVVERPEPSNP